MKPFKILSLTFLFLLTFLSGGLLNDLVLAVNDGMMPVFIGHFTKEELVLDSQHVTMTAVSHLKLLSDVIPVGDIIASAGDALLAIGLIGLFIIFLISVYSFGKSFYLARKRLKI